MQRRRRAEAVDRDDGHAQEAGHRDGEGRHAWTRRAAGRPDDETDEERRQRRGDVPLRERVQRLRCEHADLAHEQRHVRDGDRDERARGPVVLPAAKGAHGEHGRGERRQDERRGHHHPEVGDDLVDDLSRRRDVPADRAVGAEQVVPHHPAGGGEAEREQAEPCAHDPEDERREAPQHLAAPLEERVQERRQHERRQQHERLHADRAGGGHGEQHRALVERCRLLERASDGREGQRHRRIEERLAHEEAAVDERCRQHRERGRGQRPARVDQSPGPEVGGHGHERHRQRLEGLGEPDRVAEVVEQHRRADESGVEHAVVRRRETPEREVTVLPERASDLRVDHLVGSDPGHRERARRGEAHHGRGEDEGGEAEGGAVSGGERHGQETFSRRAAPRPAAAPRVRDL